MDQRRFDALARALGAGCSRRGALAALLGAMVGAMPGPAAAGGRRPRRETVAAERVASGSGVGRRRQCGAERPCADGFECRTQGRRRRCVCASGIACGTACCAAGEECRNGACAAPPPTCQAMGEACGGSGRPCCDGLQCGSGQGGKTDVACYVPAGGACGATAECVYGAACRSGRCVDVTCRCTVCAGWDAEANGLALQAALDAAAPGSTISVQAGAYVGPLQRPPLDFGDDDFTMPLLLVDRSVTIVACGEGATVLRDVVVSGDRDVTLRGLELSGSALMGAVTSVDGARVAVSGCRLSGEYVGIACLDASVAVDGRTTIADCVGAGIAADRCQVQITGPATITRTVGTGIAAAGGDLRVTGPVFVTDNVSGESAGGIVLYHACRREPGQEQCRSELATAHLQGVTVSGNVGGVGNAGGVLMRGDLVMIDSVIRDNWSGRDSTSVGRFPVGGGMVVQSFDCQGEPGCDPGGRVTLVDTVVEGNRAGPDPLGGGNASGGRGGGIALLAGSSLTMRGTSVVRNNVALPARGTGTGPQGGGIYSCPNASTSCDAVTGNTPDQCGSGACPPPA